MAKQSLGVLIGLERENFVEEGRSGNKISRGKTVYLRIRDLIDGGVLVPGQKLPSTRMLSAELGLARSTVEDAYTLLEAESWIERRIGSGSFVSNQPAPSAETPRHSEDPAGRIGSSPAKEITASLYRKDLTADPCTTEEALIPARDFARLAAQVFGQAPLQLFRDGDPMGYFALRRSISRYLASERGLTAPPAQIMITNGTQHSLDIVTRLVVAEGDTVVFEDPGYPDAWAVFRRGGARLVPVPVDAQGMCIPNVAEIPAIVYVCPSHQFPLGIEMSIDRRGELVDFAHRAQTYILEDDYDSEFRFGARRETTLFTLDGNKKGGSVFYAGTFNKVFFNTLRIGYLILPEKLVDKAAGFRRDTDAMSPVPMQAVLSEFFDRGNFAAHLRKIRGVFQSVRAGLFESLAPLSTKVTWVQNNGFSVALVFRENVDDREIAASEICMRVGARPLSAYRFALPGPSGLLLGFGKLDSARIRDLIAFLRATLL